MTEPQDVLAFWLDEVGPQGWYKQEDALDAAIRERFGAAWEAAMAGRLSHWLGDPEGTLAYLIVTDQFPRNMFRGEARAFASDGLARAATKQAIHRGWDLKIPQPQRLFFYSPLQHSENLCDQEHCVRMAMERMQEGDGGFLLHARAHREVIRRFGRFPGRNAALDRATTEHEARYQEEGGYGHTVRELQARAA